MGGIIPTGERAMKSGGTANYIRYGQLNFDSGFLFGIDDQGETIRFTKVERILLAQFVEHPKVLLSRDRLLDALSGPGSGASDRNIDFIVNRLRRKLKDSARDPRYIATQYGEGYVWVAEHAPVRSDVAKAFVVLGPVRGLTNTNGLQGRARAHIELLHAALNHHTTMRGRVVIHETCPPPSKFRGDKPQFALEIDFLAHEDELHCATTLKAFATGHVLRVSRHAVDLDPDADGSTLKARASDIVGAIWDALAYPPQGLEVPAELPLMVRMHEAGNLLGGSLAGWQEAVRDLREARWAKAEERLRAKLSEDPNDARSQLMLATCLYSKYVNGTNAMILPENDFRARDEDEMERLVTAALPRIQDNPVFMTAAGKLLYVLNRGHRRLAVSIVEKAFKATTAFATSFAALGQIRMFQGNFDTALQLFDQGLELCEDRSEFQIYLLVLKCVALLAADDRAGLDSALRLTYEKKPETRAFLPVFFYLGCTWRSRSECACHGAVHQ